MTRKRFIKLLMSHGTSRNKAVKKAEYYNFLNIPYKRAYSISMTAITFTCSDEDFKENLQIIAKAFGKLKTSLDRATEKP